MKLKEAIAQLEELIIPFERSIAEAKKGNEYEIEAEKSVEALELGIGALKIVMAIPIDDIVMRQIRRCPQYTPKEFKYYVKQFIECFK